jgi:non-ribosomal peptide synthetase component F
MALIAVFAAVVSRTCDQKDFVVTTTVHGRDLPEHEGLAGYCSHSVYLLMQLRTDERFYDLLRYVTDEFQRAMEHKDFGGIVEEHPQLRAGTLFQWLPWQRLEEIDASQAQEGQSDQLKVKRFELPFQFKHDAYYPDIYDLVWTASNTNNGILVQIFYRSEMFSATTVAQFASDFLATAERLAGDLHEPAVRIAPFDAERVSLREARHSLQSGGS